MQNGLKGQNNILILKILFCERKKKNQWNKNKPHNHFEVNIQKTLLSSTVQIIFTVQGSLMKLTEVGNDGFSYQEMFGGLSFTL